MAGTWPGSTCGYCGAAEDTRYECPTCKRSGCPTCMPNGEEERCSYCEENLKPKETGYEKYADV